MSHTVPDHATVSVLVTDVGNWMLPAHAYAELLRSHPDLRVVTDEVPQRQAVRQVERLQPDVIVLALSHRSMLSAERLDAILHQLDQAKPGVGIVVLSTKAHGLPIHHLSAQPGPRAYLSATDLPDEGPLVAAIHTVAQGMTVARPRDFDNSMQQRLVGHDACLAQLSQQKLDILRLLAKGMSNTAIADQKCLSVKAVENYVGAIYRTLNLANDHDGHRRVLAARTYLESASV